MAARLLNPATDAMKERSKSRKRAEPPQSPPSPKKRSAKAAPAPATPDEWHYKPFGYKNKNCPICGAPAHSSGLHRAASPDESGRKWLKRKRTADGWLEEEVGRPFVRKVERMCYGPTKKVKQNIARATAMLADGKMMREIARELDVCDASVRAWRAEYPELWKRALDNAMGAMIEVVQAQAGTVAILDDPATYLARAKAADKWAKDSGRDFMPVQAGTLREFYETYYKPVRLTEVCKCHLAHYEHAVKMWAFFTGDPPLKEITAATLATFRDCIKKLRGQNRVNRMSATTVREILKLIQAIIDKAGPPERRNRDAAGLIDRAPWIKPPARECKVPRIVPPELLSQLYIGLVAAEWPIIDGFKPPAFWRALIVVAYNTGLRRGTLFGLRMSDIDWQRRTILVRPSNNKSRKLFSVHLNEVAYRHLLAIRTDRTLVFPWPNYRATFNYRWHKMLDAAGIPRKEHFGMHGLRRTVATLLYEASPGAAQIALGHSDQRTTQQHYVAPSAIVARALDALPQPEAFTGGKENVA